MFESAILVVEDNTSWGSAIGSSRHKKTCSYKCDLALNCDRQANRREVRFGETVSERK